MKKELRDAFRQPLDIHEVPAGLAVGTSMSKEDGDRFGFFVIGPDADGRFVIQDDGVTIPHLAASEADFDAHIQAEAFHSLLNACGATYDDDTFELKTAAVEPSAIAPAALKFVALLQRLEDRLSLTQGEGPRGSGKGSEAARVA